MTAAGRKITASGVQRIEAGARRIDVDDLVALARALGVTPADLLGEHAGMRGHDGATPTGELAVWRVQLQPITDAIEQVLETYPHLDNGVILDHVAVALAELHLRGAQHQVAGDVVGLAVTLAFSEGARTAGDVERYLRDVRAAIDAGATTGEQIREHVRQARERAAG
jgi:transcriptional regulator with XRE-family HTH domain